MIVKSRAYNAYPVITMLFNNVCFERFAFLWKKRRIILLSDLVANFTKKRKKGDIHLRRLTNVDSAVSGGAASHTYIHQYWGVAPHTSDNRR